MKPANFQIVISALLVLAVIVSAAALISVRHLNRLAYYGALKLERQRDDLSIEWRQLMAEYSTWRLEHKVENEARGTHNMAQPSNENIETIRLASQTQGHKQ